LLVYITGWPTSNMLWFSRDGKEIGLLGTFASVRAFRISPDGSNVAMGLGERRTGAGDIWLFDRGRGISTRLHSDPVNETAPVWSPDGATIAYSSDRNGPPDIYEMALKGAPEGERPLFEGNAVEQPEDFTRDGRFLAYTSTAQWNDSDIWLLPL